MTGVLAGEPVQLVIQLRAAVDEELKALVPGGSGDSGPHCASKKAARGDRLAVAPGCQAPLMAIFFALAFISGGLGSVTVRTPFLKVALALSGSAVNGRVIERAKPP